ncbi:MAG: XdhC family protein [Methylobacillus sp.]|jgi:xanthine dehydrogenase accessory factor|nr:XdhC family protein [Methylobacillus sp.]
MDSVDLSVLKALEAWQHEAHPVWLVTVVETFGSSPRPPGAMLVLRADGHAVGSVSGGCIEDDLVRRAQSGELLADRAEKVVYGVTAEEARRFGLPCGGTLRLVIEPAHGVKWAGELLERIREHRIVRRRLNLATLQVTLEDVGSRDIDIAYDGDMLATLHGPRWRLLIIGAGQTSAYLAQMAQALDFEVTVCDPREEMRATWNVSGARLIADMPDDAVLALDVDARTAIVALTHDPKLDDMALLEALKSRAFYIGALGSKANNAKRRERLAMFDLAPEEIARLHGPVGLSIGSRTPPEIAVAILAQLIQVRSGRQQKQAQDQTQQGTACAV